MSHRVIAIDGPAASGKGTLARKLARELSMAYLDTGALYRFVAKAVLDDGKDPSSEEDAVDMARKISLRLRPEDLQDPALRTDDVGSAASVVARFPSVRQVLLDFQKEFAAKPPSEKGAVMDGRDIGTVICPNADVKFFITADVNERAKRRFKELSAKGIETTFDVILADMKDRDARDTNRDVAPLKPAPDAFVIDTGALDENQVMELALSIIHDGRR